MTEGEKKLRESKAPKLSDADRHKRFVKLAKEVEASEDPKDFERAFMKIVSNKPAPK
jgi:hypothetical protein